MNSMYGKTIVKPFETCTVIQDSQHDSEKYVSLNYNYTDSVVEVNGRYYIMKVNQSCIIIIMYMQELKY